MNAKFKKIHFAIGVILLGFISAQFCYSAEISMIRLNRIGINQYESITLRKVLHTSACSEYIINGFATLSTEPYTNKSTIIFNNGKICKIIKEVPTSMENYKTEENYKNSIDDTQCMSKSEFDSEESKLKEKYRVDELNYEWISASDELSNSYANLQKCQSGGIADQLLEALTLNENCRKEIMAVNFGTAKVNSIKNNINVNSMLYTRQLNELTRKYVTKMCK